MKRNYLFQLLALFVGCFVFFSCGSEEPSNGAGTYTPPANLTNEQILQLLQEAGTASSKETKVSLTRVDSENSKKSTRKEELDLVAKKHLWLRYANDDLYYLRYVESSIEYVYEKVDGVATKTASRINWDDVKQLSVNININALAWTVKEGKLVGTYNSASENSVCTIVLDANKRFQTIYTKSTSPDGSKTYEVTYSFQYTANPQLPAGFTKDHNCPNK